MIKDLPLYITIVFQLTVLVTLFLFYVTIIKSSSEIVRNKSTLILAGLVLWLVIQAMLTLNNLYNTDLNAFPPKILLLGVAPAIFTIIVLFSTRSGKRFIDSLPLSSITYLNVVRIPVELVLYWLYREHFVPKSMTFEGQNFDIISGITAPVAAWLLASDTNKKLILTWNFICLGLLLNVVFTGIFSVPTPLQKFDFEQPNIAILHFPFCWLPTFIVPAVLFGHLVSIRRLLR
ncbi:hypothetical protein [Dyadobacter diqingensis]|uniref:hypothetical protein n=1 Tax=Dyadobacter diqingensis TaxID=2938121 RepID=UPI0020C190C2|nr:hypothetical protein [Dyadobacter diqingensis]